MSMFRAYDIRGIVPDELDADVAKDLGNAFATYTDQDTVVVGRDNRSHGDDLSDAFITGCTAAGVDVIDLGVAPNPVITWFAREHGAAACVITASHNPPEWNGFKFRGENGRFISQETGLQEIERIYRDKEFSTGNGTVTEKKDGIAAYLNDVQEYTAVTDPLTVVVNCGNGTAAAAAPQLFNALGCETIILNGELEADFPSYMPNPQEDAMRTETSAAVTENSADLGVMFDTDSDRVGFIAADGSVIEGDQAYAILAQHLLNQETGTCLYEVKHSQIVPDTIEEHGGTPLLHRTGNSFIVNTIFDNSDIVFAGELSGHYFFPLYDRPFDDGLFAAAQFVAAYTALEHPEEELDVLRSRYKTSDEYRIPVENIHTEDGLRIHTDHGWILLRPSNTEPKISARFETANEEDFTRFETLVDALQPDDTSE